MTAVRRGRADRSGLLDALALAPQRLGWLVAGANDAALDRLPGPGEWPARTVLAHLRDDEFMVMRLRMERIAVEDHPTLVPFDEQAWAADRWPGDDARDSLVAGFALQRTVTVAFLAQLDATDWTRLGHQPQLGTFDLAWWVEHTRQHDAMHLAQVARALQPERGRGLM